MNIERVELALELLKKSSKACFWLDKEIYEDKNLNEVVYKLEKQYGLIIKVYEFKNKVELIIQIKQ